jgi:hypothetical protein
MRPGPPVRFRRMRPDWAISAAKARVLKKRALHSQTSTLQALSMGGGGDGAWFKPAPPLACLGAPGAGATGP